MHFTDIHEHLLWGIDDGPKSLQKMQEMLDRANAEQMNRIIATPHVTPGVHRVKREQMREALEQGRAYCAEKGYEIELYEGAEILYTGQTPRMLQDGEVPTLAGTGFVLVEFSPDDRFEKIYDAADTILRSGFLPILAHVERYRCIAAHLKNAQRIKRELEVYFQVNCASVIDKKGFFTNRFVDHMLDEGMIDAVATDAHNITSRPARMREAYAALEQKCGANYARHLTTGALVFSKNS